MQSLAGPDGSEEQLLRHLVSRSVRFRQALISLYVGVGLLSLGALMGGLTTPWPTASRWAVQAVSGGVILSVVFAAAVLIRESIHSAEVVQFCGRRALARAREKTTEH